VLFLAVFLVVFFAAFVFFADLRLVVMTRSPRP